MLDFKAAKRYIKYNGFRFLLNNGPYYIVYFSENSEYLIDKPKLSFRPIDFRNVSFTNTNMPRIHLTNEIVQEYRDQKLIVNTPNNNPKNKNIIVDSTVYVGNIDKRFSPITYQNRYGDMIYKYIYKLFQAVPTINHKKIFFYSVDLKNYKSTYQKSKFFTFLEGIKKGNIFFDYLVLCIINQEKVTYRILIKDEKIDYNKILFYIRNLK